MSWILFLLSIIGFALTFTTKSMVLATLGLLLGFGGLFGSVFAIIANRIQLSAQSEASLLTDKEVNMLRASVRKPSANSTVSNKREAG